jgi:hypothetical protein
MPFNKDTAAAAGKVGGGKRWQGKFPSTNRNKQVKISVTEAERDAISEKAKAAGLSIAEFIVRAVKAYNVN